MNQQPADEPNFELRIEEASIQEAQLGQAGRDLHQVQYVTVYDNFNLTRLFRSQTRAPTTVQEHRFRQILLSKVKQYWIEDILEQSLHTKNELELGLQEQSNAIAHPFDSIISIPQATEATLTQGASINDVFNQMESGRTLLILGEPGAGKTTVMLKLAQSLLAQAQASVTQTIPVVFNLSSWASKRQPIADWLIQELSSKYGVSSSLGKTWVKQQQLLLLLDGLDEVKHEYRETCVQALNRFIQKYGQTEMVVCSRINDYQALSVRLSLRAAIYVQPLNSQQIEQYLDRSADQLQGVKKLLQSDRDLLELAKSPLILSIMSLAYRGISSKELPDLNSASERRQHLFNTYIDQMFQRRGTRTYDQKQVLKWLMWLAQQMIRSSRTVFLLEEIQPNWLPNQTQKLLYRLLSLLIGIIIFGSMGWLIEPQDLIKSVWLGILLVIPGLGWDMNEIKTVETLSWSWKEARQNLLDGIIGGLVLGIPIGILLPVENKLMLGLVYGISGGFIFGLIGGLKGPEIKVKVFPNQGIWSSAKNAVIIGLIGAVVGSLLGALIQITWLRLGLIYGAILGLIFGGGKACIQHFTLRLILYLNGSIPWNYTRFLRFTSDRIFLQQVGGGYIFIHRMLLEHLTKKLVTTR